MNCSAILHLLVYINIHAYIQSIHYSTLLRTLSAGTPGASVWLCPRQMPGLSPSLRDRTFQAPIWRDRLRLTRGDRRLVDDTSAPPRHTLQCVLQSEMFWGHQPPQEGNHQNSCIYRVGRALFRLTRSTRSLRKPSRGIMLLYLCLFHSKGSQDYTPKKWLRSVQPFLRYLRTDRLTDGEL